MKKLITALFCSVIGVSAFGQWTPTAINRGSNVDPTKLQLQYKLDLDKIQSQLKNAQETGANSKPVQILLPNLRGKLEKFEVYSFPVMAKELASQYQLGSYVGVSVDNPNKYLRFSVSPTNFQSTTVINGQYEFIDAEKSDKTVYSVHSKSSDAKDFNCNSSEDPTAVKQLGELMLSGQSFNNQTGNFSKNSDKKYRTMRLAISVTGEYTAFHGGTVASALSAINATMTRVNFVFEKDLALHLNVQNFPGIIYTDAATDPYTGNLNVQLQQTLTANVGNANYDIGHVFNAAGNNGNAGCIGCVCIDPATPTTTAKGSGFTQSTSPVGDTFDIDFVAHEMGHQLGGNHTFSHALEGAGVNMEPGSGSTIMGYAGITNANVQMNSDPYFHVASIVQIQNNLTSKTCDVETTITNNPPTIAALPTYSIPKGTAFVLTASATDPENDPMTYTWEQFNAADVAANTNADPITLANLGNTTFGASFRSLSPTTSPTRYFPKLSSVLNGVLVNANNSWESVSNVARTSSFAVTVRDNNLNPAQQQTNSALQTINVGADGPFKVSDQMQYGYTNIASPILWDVVNTTAAPYNVANVKIDYTLNNGTTWNVLLASTANDGTESFTFPASLNNQNIKLRISSIGNVFYAVKSVYVTTSVACGTAISGINITNVSSTGAAIDWAPVSGASSYVIRYKKTTETVWQQITSNVNNVVLASLLASSVYEVQVASVCGTQSPFSSSTNFTTPATTYCTISATNSPQFEYISNVTLSKNGIPLFTNTSGASNYTDYTTNAALQSNLAVNNSYSLSIAVTTPDYDAAVVFIDFNKNGVFENSERVLNYPVAVPTAPITGTFTVPATAIVDQPLRMRVILAYLGQASAGGSINSNYAGCGTISYGEAEDYNVIVSSALSTNELNIVKDGIQIYPNPVSDILNVTKVSDKATYKIYSAAGQLASSGNIIGGKINVTSLVKGAYVISIEDKGKENFNSKFIKK
ncbi:reprolysin-like metallopeptidase [Chryseobacterium wangxinyae]|uniref:reprolysin-like metallopeptidase n=1 Tax=Chryseobacterium sp. CY353 TaxID=2997334 RepID=UPI00226E172E|nr:zinc-dependent metalloprotease family protein [Chryseobacterium sp. CY353]MCY0970296.1 M12 family metallo-peptidase [Chryseobacterium sp. CY353]